MVIEARESITHIVSTAHPDWSVEQVRHEVIRRMSRVDSDSSRI